MHTARRTTWQRKRNLSRRGTTPRSTRHCGGGRPWSTRSTRAASRTPPAPVWATSMASPGGSPICGSWASTRSGCRPSTRANSRTAATTWPTTVTWIRSSARWTTSTGWPPPRMRQTSKWWWTSCPTTAPTCTPGSVRRWRAAPAPPRATGTSSATARARTATSRRPAGRTISEVRHGRAWTTANGTCTCSPRSSPTGTGGTRTCAPISLRRCVSGAITAWTGSASMWRTGSPRTSTATTSTTTW